MLYVLEIDKNLLSVGQLVEKGYKVFFENKSSLIKNGGEKDILRDTSSCNSISLSTQVTNSLKNELLNNDSNRTIWI